MAGFGAPISGRFCAPDDNIELDERRGSEIIGLTKPLIKDSTATELSSKPPADMLSSHGFAGSGQPMGQSTVTATLEDVAVAALSGDSLHTRSLMQDWLAARPDLERLPPPLSQDSTTRSLLAALAELMAQRLGQNPPHGRPALARHPSPCICCGQACI